MAHLIFLSLLVSLDGFFSGFTFRLKKIRICLPQLLFISLCPLVIVTAVMLSSQRMTAGIPAGAAKGLGFVLFFCLAYLSFADALKKRKSSPAAEQPRSVASGSGLKPGQRSAGLQLRAGWRAGHFHGVVFCVRQFSAGHGRQSLPGAAVYRPF